MDNWLWKTLGTCCETANRMNEWTLNMEETSSTENLVTTCRTKCRHVPKDGTVHSDCHRNPNSREHTIFLKKDRTVCIADLHHHHHHHHHHCRRRITYRVLGLVSYSDDTNSREAFWGVVVRFIPHRLIFHNFVRLCPLVQNVVSIYFSNFEFATLTYHQTYLSRDW
jgi:hypothetical protein